MLRISGFYQAHSQIPLTLPEDGITHNALADEANSLQCSHTEVLIICPIDEFKQDGDDLRPVVYGELYSGNGSNTLCSDSSNSRRG
jgi:hypothetical protein